MKHKLFLLFIILSTKLYAQPDTVKIGTYIISVHDIDFHDKEYTLRFWLWYLYDNPDFDFITQLDIPNAKVMEENTEVFSDNLEDKIWKIMKMKCVMKEKWSVRDFPFDTQHLKVQIENTLFDENALVFAPDTTGSRFNDDEAEALDGWRMKTFRVSAGSNDYETGFGDPGFDRQVFSTFMIEMDLARDATGLFMKIFIGMYIAFLISIISFTPHPSEMEPRFGLPVGGLFAAVGNKYIIDSLLPVSSEFTLVDTLHTMTFGAIFMTLVVSAYALNVYDKGRKEESEKINRVGARIVIGVYVIANILFVSLAIF